MSRNGFFLIILIISGMVQFGIDKNTSVIATVTGSKYFASPVSAPTNSGGTKARTSSEALCGSAENIPNSCLQTEQNILSSTLRIEIETWIIYVEGQGYSSLSSNGHGTVINDRYFLTHNHFRVPLMELLADEDDSKLATITLYNAEGDLLWRGPLTTTSLAFDDSETLLLEFLDKDDRGLFRSMGIPPAEILARGSAPLAPGTMVAQVNWDENQAYVQWTKVKAMANDKGTPVVELMECLIPGSSGGGVFINGAHIANNWSRSQGCIDETVDGSQLYSTAALNSTELLAAIQ